MLYLRFTSDQILLQVLTGSKEFVKKDFNLPIYQDKMVCCLLSDKSKELYQVKSNSSNFQLFEFVLAVLFLLLPLNKLLVNSIVFLKVLILFVIVNRIKMGMFIDIDLELTPKCKLFLIILFNSVSQISINKNLR